VSESVCRQQRTTRNDDGQLADQRMTQLHIRAHFDASLSWLIQTVAQPHPLRCRRQARHTKAERPLLQQAQHYRRCSVLPARAPPLAPRASRSCSSNQRGKEDSCCNGRAQPLRNTRAADAAAITSQLIRRSLSHCSILTALSDQSALSHSSAGVPVLWPHHASHAHASTAAAASRCRCCTRYGGDRCRCLCIRGCCGCCQLFRCGCRCVSTAGLFLRSLLSLPLPQPTLTGPPWLP
jgi:hypothetical protein